MATSDPQNYAKVFMSGRSQAVRIPKKFRFPEGCDTVTIRQVGPHLVLSPRFASWEDYWANSTRPTEDFVKTVLELRSNDLPVEERQGFD